MLEVQLDAVLYANEVSFVGTVDSRCVGDRTCFYPGFVASTPGHPIVGYAIETLLHAVLVERFQPAYEVDEIIAYLGRFFHMDSLPVWQTRFAKDVCPLAVGVHRSLDNTSPYLPMKLDLVPLQNKEDALFLLVSCGKCC